MTFPDFILEEKIPLEGVYLGVALKTAERNTSGKRVLELSPGRTGSFEMPSRSFLSVQTCL